MQAFKSIGMHVKKSFKMSVYLHGGVKMKWCVYKIHRTVWVYQWEINNNNKYITSLADDTQPITTAPALFLNTRTDATIKTRFTVGTWDRTECTSKAPVAPTIVLHHNPSADVYIHIGYMAAAKRKEIDTALYTEHTDSSIYRPLLYRLYTLWFNDINLWFRWVFLLFGVNKCFVV